MTFVVSSPSELQELQSALTEDIKRSPKANLVAPDDAVAEEGSQISQAAEDAVVGGEALPDQNPVVSDGTVAVVEGNTQADPVVPESAVLEGDLQAKPVAPKIEPPPDFKWGVRVGDDLKRKLSLRVWQAAISDCKVVLFGESGVGKEVVARAIHKNSSRSGGRFIAFNCSAVPEGLIESELFGHEAGAFTGATKREVGKFEAADKGTIFLDEIGEMGLPMQTRLLRAIETGEITPLGSWKTKRVDVRLIAASNQDLFQLVKERKFREDLFWRLGAVQIHVPPLRERKADIVYLANEFLSLNEVRGMVVPLLPLTLSPQAEEALLSYHWPGNIRQLRSVMEAVATFAKGNEISREEVEVYFSGVSPRKPETDTTLFQDDNGKAISWEEFDRKFTIPYLSFLLRTGGNKRQAAILADVSRTTMIDRLRRFRVIP